MVLTMHTAFPGSQGLKSFSLKAQKTQFNLRKYVYAINKQYSYALFFDKPNDTLISYMENKESFSKNPQLFFPASFLISFFDTVFLISVLFFSPNSSLLQSCTVDFRLQIAF